MPQKSHPETKQTATNSMKVQGLINDILISQTLLRVNHCHPLLGLLLFHLLRYTLRQNNGWTSLKNDVFFFFFKGGKPPFSGVILLVLWGCRSCWFTGAVNPSEFLVKLDHVPNVRGENKPYLKPPPSLVWFRLVTLSQGFCQFLLDTNPKRC